MKLRNKSGLIAAIAGLTAVSLFSVGFASWVISGGDTATYENGQISVSQVSDSNLYLFVNEAPTLQAIVFGKPTSPESFANPWLTTPEVPNENLTFSFDVEVTNLTEDNCGTILSATIASSNSTKYDAAVSEGIIQALPELTVVWKQAGSGSNPLTGIATISGTFKWALGGGNGTNPYNYYNAHGAKDTIGETSTTYAADAKAKLSKLYDLNDVTYSVTVVATAPNA